MSLASLAALATRKKPACRGEISCGLMYVVYHLDGLVQGGSRGMAARANGRQPSSDGEVELSSVASVPLKDACLISIYRVVGR